MTIVYKIKAEKLQYDINTEAAKVSVLSSGKIDEYEYLTEEEILLSHQSRIMEQAKKNWRATKNKLKLLRL